MVSRNSLKSLIISKKSETAGELNFTITVVVDLNLMKKDGIRYAHINEVIGAMKCTNLELYRRIVDNLTPY